MVEYHRSLLFATVLGRPFACISPFGLCVVVVYHGEVLNVEILNILDL